jgi:hypothetical protein
LNLLRQDVFAGLDNCQKSLPELADSRRGEINALLLTVRKGSNVWQTEKKQVTFQAPAI